MGVAGFEGLGIVGIPVADGIFFFGHMLWLLAILRRRAGLLEGRSIGVTLAKALIASMVGAAVAWAVMTLSADLADLAGGFLIQLALAGALGLLACYGLMVILRVEEVRGLLTRVMAGLGRGVDGP
jgi:peptidoglycan biosynthesis protein MviN/MurJ (putative lipid II flippase)